jgi:prepilin-type N-terminal cleavage/methylation domain-containing protein
MVFKLTNPEPKTAAFTLVEMMVAMLIGAVVLTAIVSFYCFSITSFASMTNYADLNLKDRNACDLISRDLRSATSVLTADATTLSLSLPTTNVTYTYNSANKTLTRIQGNDGRTLLRGITSLNWTLYSRPTNGAAYNNFPVTSNVGLAKFVSLQWSCKRAVAKAESDSESVQQLGLIEMRNE